MSSIELMKPSSAGMGSTGSSSVATASSPTSQKQQQVPPQRPVPISLRAQSNVETKAAARKGLLNIMMNKFSSTPLQEDEYTDVDAMKLRQRIYDTTNNTDRNNLDLIQYDASLTKSERAYLRHIILSGDTNSIQSASAILQNEDVFPVQQQLIVSNSSNSSDANSSTNRSNSCGDLSVIANDDDDDYTATTATDDYYKDEKKDNVADDHQQNVNKSNTTSNSDQDMGATTKVCGEGAQQQYRDSMIQQQLFRLHESNKDLQPNELIQRMSRQNSMLTTDDSTTTITATGCGNNNNSSTSFRHYRSMSPPPITEGEVLLVSARSLDIDLQNNNIENDAAVIAGTGDISTKNDLVLQIPTSVDCNFPTTTPTVHPREDAMHHQVTSVLSKESAVHVDIIDSWNPFDDISSWLDGSQGVEVTASTQTACEANPVDIVQSILKHSNILVGNSNVTSNNGNTTMMNHTINYNYNNITPQSQQPFRILGTSADDVSCHPHVLSPPLMESLLAFVPEYHSTQHYLNTTMTATIMEQYALRSQLQQQQHPFSILESETPVDTANNNRPTVATAANSDDRDASLDCQQFTCQADTTCGDKTIANNTANVTTTEQRQHQFATSSMMHSSLSTTSSSNFWLKYSLVRDGPGLWTFLRQVRASAICILAIETSDGHVLGAYTSQPWRLSKGWYGNKDTFLWKMRRSRLETAGKSILQQICQESEIQVYPYRTGNVAVQYCSKKCLMLGQGEVIPSPKKHNPDKPRPSSVGKHYGYALLLDKDLTSGTTSSSETFGNPCLLDSTQRGARFTVANIEVWTLTPHTTVADAEQSELSNLFLDGGRDSAHRLNFMNILVGGPI